MAIGYDGGHCCGVRFFRLSPRGARNGPRARWGAGSGLLDIFLVDTTRSAHATTPLAATDRSIVERVMRGHLKKVFVLNFSMDLLGLQSLLLLVDVNMVMVVAKLCWRLLPVV